MIRAKLATGQGVGWGVVSGWGGEEMGCGEKCVTVFNFGVQMCTTLGIWTSGILKVYNCR
jgi:hypothetical protein